MQSMKMRRLISGAIATLGLAVAGLVGTPTSAHASLDQCASAGRICVWEHADYGGAYGGYDRQVDAFPEALNNRISSVWNRHSNAWVFFDGPGYALPLFCLKPHARVRNLADHHGPGTAPFADRIGSARRTGNVNCPPGVHVIY